MALDQEGQLVRQMRGRNLLRHLLVKTGALTGADEVEASPIGPAQLGVVVLVGAVFDRTADASHRVVERELPARLECALVGVVELCAGGGRDVMPQERAVEVRRNDPLVLTTCRS